MIGPTKVYLSDNSFIFSISFGCSASFILSHFVKTNTMTIQRLFKRSHSIRSTYLMPCSASIRIKIRCKQGECLKQLSNIDPHFFISFLSPLAKPQPGGSTSIILPPLFATEKKYSWRVLPGYLDVYATSFLTRQLIRVDFPTFERPE